MSTAQEIRDFKDNGSWRTLAALAAEMVADAEESCWPLSVFAEPRTGV